MKRTETMSAGDVLRQVIDEANLGNRLAEVRAVELWPQIIGTDIAGKCMRPYVKAGVMSIRCIDAALRHELHMQRSSIARAINTVLKGNIIREIRFIG